MADATHYLDDEPEEGFRPTAGTYVSAVGHAGLVVWLVAGWGLSQEPIPFETVDVSLVSSEDFAEIISRGTPEAASEPVALEAPQLEAPPEVTPEEPVVPVTPEVRPEVPVDEVTPVPLEPVAPPAEVDFDAPVLEVPAAPTAPDLPVTQDTPQVEAAPRIAPEAAPAPPLDADVAPEVQQEVTESDTPAEVIEDPAEAAAPLEATTEIVTEAEEPSGAVETSLRPPSRPAALVPAPEPEEVEVAETPAPEAPAEDSTVDDLLAELTQTPDAPAETTVAGDPGPPMTGGERDAFGLAVQDCWIVDPGSQAATVSVVVAFSLERDGTVVGDNVQMISNSGGTEGAIRSAFDAARRAVLRCQRGGYDLPEEKYERWRDVEMTFNPETMRVR